MKVRYFLFFVFCLLLVSGCKKKEEGKVLAKVGNTVLTEEEFYSLIPSQYIGTLTASQKKELLKKWIETELLYQEAREKEIHKDPEVKQRIDEMEREMIVSAFLGRYIRKLGSVDESQAREHFNSHREEYNTERKAAQIVVQNETQAYEILERLKKGEQFSELAREYSIDPSAKRGGIIGYVRRGDFPQLPELEYALFSLKNRGDISEPVQTNYGYHIIKLLRKRSVPEKVEYKDVREKIRNFLNLRKQKRAVDELLTKLREKKEIEENYSLLE